MGLWWRSSPAPRPRPWRGRRFGIAFAEPGLTGDDVLRGADLAKLDRGFMAAVPDAPAQRRLVAGIARLGETLGVCMVAEGIERQAQLFGLVDLGVRLGQGLMLGGPVRADAFAERLAAVPRVLDRTVLKPA